MKILIAEDQTDLAIIMQRFLADHGYECDLVFNGHEAVMRIVEGKEKYDLCFMDIDMPLMNGCEAAREIRRQTEYFPIVAVTGDINFEDEYIDCGMDAIIKKPFEFNELINIINKFLIINNEI